jgi:hypothetical protein
MKEIIFVSFEPGTRGHYIARVIASLPHVHWYSHPDNGIHPWNLASAKHSSIRQRHAFPNHFDRIVNGRKLPPTWDYVSKFFPDSDKYYNEIFFPRFDEISREIDKTIVYCTHSLPSDLLRVFDKCKILNVAESTDIVVNKYLRTTANFPGYIRAADIVDESNPWLMHLEHLKGIKENFTVADLWAWDRYQELYTASMKDSYSKDLYEMFEPRVNDRHMAYDQTLSIRMHPDWHSVKSFLND